MKAEVIPSPTGKDVMLKIDDVFSLPCTNGNHKMVMTLPELHELEWAIRKYLEGSPMRNLKEGGGHE